MFDLKQIKLCKSFVINRELTMENYAINQTFLIDWQL